MTISFLNSGFLVLIPIVLIAVFTIGVIDLKKRIIKKDKFKLFLTVSRMIILLSVILSMAGLQINLLTNETQTMFVADLSDSVKNTDEILEYIKNKIESKPENAEVGLLLFGENSAVEKMPDKSNNNYEFNSVVNKDGTNIEQALKTAENIMDNAKNKKIVLISDGGENIGQALKAAEEIKDNNGVIDSYYIENDLDYEVQISALNVDSKVNKNAQYEIEVTVYSVSDNIGNLILYKNDKVIHNSNVKLQKGDNRFLISDIADKGGGIILKAEILLDNDSFKINNNSYAYTYVADTPKVLIIENNNKSGEEIYSALNINGFQLKREYVGNEYDIKTLAEYDAVIIADCSFDELGEKTVNNIESYVKNSGGGLFVTGGKNSFGLGNYENTTLEQILPVNINPTDESEEHELSMIIVIDRSGSMGSGNYGVTSLSLAKEAVLSAIDTLKDKDRFGVIAFDDTPKVINELEIVAGNKENIKKNVNSISLGGGTSILPALEQAVTELEAADTKYKHIILMTDGQGEDNGYSQLVERIQKAGITLSSVAVGTESDKTLLQSLAEIGYGRYYYTDEFTDLPKIFVNETKTAGKAFINETDFYPNAAGNSSLISDINSIPMLSGYIASSFKSEAERVLDTDNEEPVLAFMRYGLGTTGVFTTDTANWCGNWFSSNDGMNIFVSSISKVLKNNDLSNINVEIKSEDGVYYVFAQSDDADLNINSGKIIGEDSENTLDFKLVSANSYKAKVENLKEGFYTVNVNFDTQVSKNNNITAYDFVSWPKEYDFSNTQTNKALMEEIAVTSGGEIINQESDIFTTLEPKIYINKNLSNILMTIALILFIIDIVIRKFKDILLLVFKRCFSKRNVIKDDSVNNNTQISTNASKKKSELPKDEEKSQTAEILALNKKKRIGR